MEEGFELPVLYNGKELSFPARLVPFGYTYKIEVEVNGTMVALERDEERNWRALLSFEDLEKNKSVDQYLISAIVDALESHL